MSICILHIIELSTYEQNQKDHNKSGQKLPSRL